MASHYRYQTHQLRNVFENFCATLNCYSYDEKDQVQYNMFDYGVYGNGINKDKEGFLENFEPVSDMSYGEMKQIVLREFANKKEPIERLKYDIKDTCHRTASNHF